MGIATRRLALVWIMAAGACAEARPTVGPAARDSLGVMIVEYGRLPDRIAFVLQDPIYRVGWDESGHGFERILSGVLLSDGSAALGDIGASELVVFDSDGGLKAVLGGKGEGPGQIGLLMSVSRLAGDTLVVEDDGNGRMSYYHGEHVVRSERLQDGLTALTTRSLGAVGRNLVTTAGSYDPMFEEEWLQAPLILQGLDSEAWDTLALYDFMQRIPRDRLPNPFRPEGYAAVSVGSLLVARGDQAQVRELDSTSGDTRRIIRWIQTGAALNDSSWAVYAKWAQDRNPSGRAAQLSEQQRREREAVEGPLPLMSGLHGDEEGRVWVAEFTPDFQHPARYGVFTAEGDWLGWVEMPPRFEVLYIGSARILGIQRNQVNVEAAVVLPFK